ncbi:type VII secretion integral membrane protein EccD [Streptomyces boninensis]|uniref:type VII secretion integral membrane protein EccD n=1 Tax=Streptomyces boninensis TaxID=2039455 RepID=UPI003B227011
MNAGAAVGRSGLSRVTLVGDRRRIDLVLPSSEPVGRLLPEVLELLGDRAGARPELRQLVTASGLVLAPESSLADAGIADGAVVRLVRTADAPAAPIVHDVADEAAEDLDVRAWRWEPRSRRISMGAAALVMAFAAAVLARAEYPGARVAEWVLGIAGLVFVVGAVLGRAGRRGLAITLIGMGGVLAGYGAWSAADAHDWSGLLRLVGVVAAVAVMLFLLGGFTPLGRGGVVAGGALAVTLGAWALVTMLQSGGETTGQQARIGGVLAVGSLVVLGLLPRLALMASGLSALDDRRVSGASVSRYRVATALAATHRGLALTTVALAVSVTAAGVLIVQETTVWTVSLAALVAVVLMLRARAYPLTAEVVVLGAAGAVMALRLVWVWLEQSERAIGPIAVLVGLAVVPLLVLAVEPAEHVRARLRRIGDLLETVGVIVMFPLVIGMFGVYGRLLDTFA